MVQSCSPCAPHQSNLLTFTWLLCLNYGLRPSKAKTFFLFFILFSSPPGTKRPPPTHVSTMPLTTPHRGVSTRRLERGAPQCIPCLHCLPEHAAAARHAHQQLDHDGLTAGHGLVEGGAEVAVAGIPRQQVRRAASTAAAAGRADLPPPATAVGVDPNAIVVVVVRPPGDEHLHRGH